MTAATIKAFVLGPLETNSYLVRSREACCVVDAGPLPQPLLRFLTESDLAPDRILLTHGHGDHIAGIREIRAAFPHVKVCCPRADAALLTDATLNMSGMLGLPVTVTEADEHVRPGEIVDIGLTRWRVLDTSGHTAGGVSYYCPGQRVVFTGDALFAGSIGRTDIPGGDQERLLRNIRDNLLALPAETVMLPGHGPASTIGAERRENPFFAAPRDRP